MFKTKIVHIKDGEFYIMESKLSGKEYIFCGKLIAVDNKFLEL